MTQEEKSKKYYDVAIQFCAVNGYTILSEQKDFKTYKSVVRYTCPLHGVQSVKYTSIASGKRCYHCSRNTALAKKAKTTLKQRQMSLYKRAKSVADNSGYLILTPMENITKNTSSIQYLCDNGHKNSMRINNFINGRKCPDCKIINNRNRNKLPINLVVEKIESVGGKLLNPDDYINNATKNLFITCPECGSMFTTSLRNFIQHGGQLCTNCMNRESNGERKIRLYLEKNNIDYNKEKIFQGCVDIKSLPFDFYLPAYNLCIEFDGKQHFEDRHYKGGYYYDSLEYTQKHDNIKNDYCRRNNIRLIRIPYWDYNNIERIISDNIHKDIV